MRELLTEQRLSAYCDRKTAGNNAEESRQIVLRLRGHLHEKDRRRDVSAVVDRSDQARPPFPGLVIPAFGEGRIELVRPSILNPTQFRRDTNA